MALFLVTGGLKSPAVGHLLTRGLGAIAPMPLDLLEAIVARLSADGDVSDIVGTRIRSDWAKGLQPPYILIYVQSSKVEYESPEEDDSVPTVEMPRIQISCFAPTKVATNALAKAVRASLNDAPLVYEDGYLLHLRYSDFKDVPEPAPGPGSTINVYHRAVMFDAFTERDMD